MHTGSDASSDRPHVTGDADVARPDLPRVVGFWGAVSVLVGVVIGSGIFQTPAFIAANLGSPWLILLLWGAGGLIALCGALTFAELAARFPSSGGVYVFLREGYGPVVAFVFGWTYMLITKPSAAGGIAIIFAEHLNLLTGLKLNPQATTCVALFVLTLINALGVRGSTRFAVVLTALKFSAVFGVIVIGAWAAARGVGVERAFEASPSPKPLILALAPVMAAIMWTYDGWADVGAIAGEVKEPRRTLPRVFIAGTLAVTGLYGLANAVYLWHIPLEVMRETRSVAPLLLEGLTGPIGAAAVTVIIIVSTLGSSHASVMTGARVTFAQARDGLLFRALGRIDPKRQTPATALWVQFALSCAAVLLLRDFSSLAESFVFTMWLFYGLGAGALFIIRRRDGRAEVGPGFRTPGYPVVPALFILASAAMTGLAVWAEPGRTGMWLLVLAAGVPTYWIWRRFSGPGSA
ncbi:MAG: amino acid permease [Planctomycetes bacterium]|nr:amino acid permease [Planctomycetota bacterium]